MMTYQFSVVELDASSLVSQVEGEPEQDFLERVAAAENKHLFSLEVMCFRNGKGTKRTTHSPYFRKDSPEDRNAVFREALKQAGSQIIEREDSLPPDEEKYEQPLIVVP